jgi:hypothetical protein
MITFKSENYYKNLERKNTMFYSQNFENQTSISVYSFFQILVILYRNFFCRLGQKNDLFLLIFVQAIHNERPIQNGIFQSLPCPFRNGPFFDHTLSSLQKFDKKNLFCQIYYLFLINNSLLAKSSYRESGICI